MTLFLCLPQFFSPCFLIKSTFFLTAFLAFLLEVQPSLPPLSNEFLLFLNCGRSNAFFKTSSLFRIDITLIKRFIKKVKIEKQTHKKKDVFFSL